MSESHRSCLSHPSNNQLPGVVEFYDFPKWGIWPNPVQASPTNNGYFITFNLNAGQHLLILNRDDIINLVAAPRQQDLAIPNAATGADNAVLPADVDGWAFPPVDEPGILMAAEPGAAGDVRDELQFWRVTIDWNTPNSLAITAPTLFNVGLYTILARRNPPPVPQPGTTQRLDGRGSRLMYRLPYRNFGMHDAIVAAHGVADTSVTPSVGRVRWYEIRGLTTDGTATVIHNGEFGTGTTWRWQPTIAMDGVGNIGLGYSISSATVFPSLAVTGRLASDPQNVMLNRDQIAFAGSGVEDSDRWGDYFSMAIDPVDDRTFW